MDAAGRVLIVGGMSVLSFGLLLGVPMAMERKKAARAPRYLMAAHLAAIIQGGLLLALTLAVRFSGMSPVVELTAAALLVGGVSLFDLGLALNWRRGVEDAFGENSLGNRISAVGTPMVLVGTGIIFYGVIAAL